MFYLRNKKNNFPLRTFIWRPVLRLATIFDFAIEDCLYHSTCKKRFYRHFGKHRESEDVSPNKLGLQKIAFELKLGFENIEIYTL